MSATPGYTRTAPTLHGEPFRPAYPGVGRVSPGARRVCPIWPGMSLRFGSGMLPGVWHCWRGKSYAGGTKPRGSPTDGWTMAEWLDPSILSPAGPVAGNGLGEN
jgi:hypothetical protein